MSRSCVDCAIHDDGYCSVQGKRVTVNGVPCGFYQIAKVADETLPRYKVNNKNEVEHPKHYTEHASGVECIQITEHMNFNLGNATKYIWRSGLKSNDKIKDLEKAKWYVNREIERVKKFELSEGE